MANDEQRHVVIDEPVELKPNGRRVAERGRRWLIVGYMLLAFGNFFGLYLAWQASSHSKDVARSLAAEVLHRCQVSEQSRAVLRQEHTRKVDLYHRQLARLNAFINAGRTIPGLTKAELIQSRNDLRENIITEEVLLSQVQPRPCKKLEPEGS